MKKCLVILMASCFAMVSCANSAEDWEKSFKGTWSLIGMAEMNYHSIEDMANYQVADAIDSRLNSEYNPMTLDLRDGLISFSSGDGNIYYKGSYTIDDDGIVTADWGDDTSDVYWMYAQGIYLYMIEFLVDDFGEIQGTQNAFKFMRTNL